MPRAYYPRTSGVTNADMLRNYGPQQPNYPTARLAYSQTPAAVARAEFANSQGGIGPVGRGYPMPQYNGPDRSQDNYSVSTRPGYTTEYSPRAQAAKNDLQLSAENGKQKSDLLNQGFQQHVNQNYANIHTAQDEELDALAKQAGIHRQQAGPASGINGTKYSAPSANAANEDDNALRGRILGNLKQQYVQNPTFADKGLKTQFDAVQQQIQNHLTAPQQAMLNNQIAQGQAQTADTNAHAGLQTAQGNQINTLTPHQAGEIDSRTGLNNATAAGVPSVASKILFPWVNGQPPASRAAAATIDPAVKQKAMDDKEAQHQSERWASLKASGTSMTDDQLREAFPKARQATAAPTTKTDTAPPSNTIDTINGAINSLSKGLVPGTVPAPAGPQSNASLGTPMGGQTGPSGSPAGGYGAAAGDIVADPAPPDVPGVASTIGSGVADAAMGLGKAALVATNPIAGVAYMAKKASDYSDEQRKATGTMLPNTPQTPDAQNYGNLAKTSRAGGVAPQVAVDNRQAPPSPGTAMGGQTGPSGSPMRPAAPAGAPTGPVNGSLPNNGIDPALHAAITGPTGAKPSRVPGVYFHPSMPGQPLMVNDAGTHLVPLA